MVSAMPAQKLLTSSHLSFLFERYANVQAFSARAFEKTFKACAGQAFAHILCRELHGFKRHAFIRVEIKNQPVRIVDVLDLAPQGCSSIAPI